MALLMFSSYYLNRSKQYLSLAISPESLVDCDSGIFGVNKLFLNILFFHTKEKNTMSKSPLIPSTGIKDFFNVFYLAPAFQDLVSEICLGVMTGFTFIGEPFPFTIYSFHNFCLLISTHNESDFILFHNRKPHF